MLVFTLFLFSTLLAASSQADGADSPVPPFNPTNSFLISCGESSDVTSDTGRTWSREDPKLIDSNPQNASFTSSANGQDPSVPRHPYMTARIFRSEFTYLFPVLPGPKFVRLYFYPTRYGTDFDAVTSFFSVNVNGFSIMRNFSAGMAVNASKTDDKIVIKEFIIPVRENNRQMLNLTITPSGNSIGFVNGIEIVSMPPNLYTGGQLHTVGGTVSFDIDGNTTAFETVYRLNVGGADVDDVNDSGMNRTWKRDDTYILDAALGLTPNMPGVQIKYTPTTPPYVAPSNVYSTYRTMGKDPNINRNFNLSWYFPVDVGFNYIMRLHFCETQPEITIENQRVFTVYIANQTAMVDADVIHLSGGNSVPVYQDFVKLVSGGGGEERQDLWLQLHPNEDSKPKFADAILNGLEIFKVNNSDGNLAGLNPKPNINRSPTSSQPNKPPQGNKKHKTSKILIITFAVLGCALLLASIVFAVLFARHRKDKSKEYDTIDAASKAKSSWDRLIPNSPASAYTPTTFPSPLPLNRCHQFSISEIRAATSDFDKTLVIGEGGFGKVYKGFIDGGSTVVAIKRSEAYSNQGIKEFRTELEMLSKLRHVHLVSLIGFCDDQGEMILVYEYMSQGTLREHLYKKGNKSKLSWKQRLEICIESARGLLYLHTGAKFPIIHRDIKSTNILLDENLKAKVSDFGLSREGPTSVSQTHVSTTAKGTFGYMDPEYFRNHQLTEKSDVYSFGVVLFEVLCARPAFVQGLSKEEGSLANWARINHSKGTLYRIIDPHLTADITSISLDKFCEIAVRCLLNRGAERPTMNDVVWALEFALQLHETAGMDVAREDGDLVVVPPSSRVETKSTYDDANMFSDSTGKALGSTTTDEQSFMRDSSQSEAVFSEIVAPKAR